MLLNSNITKINLCVCKNDTLCLSLKYTDLWCSEWCNSRVDNWRVCWLEHFRACLLHAIKDHLARRSPGLPLPSAPLCWYVEKHNQHTLVTNLFTIDYLTPGAVGHLCLCRHLRRSRQDLVLLCLIYLQEPQKYFCRKLCVYLMCVTGAGEMAGIMGFIYVHTHLLCPVSGTLTRGTHSSGDTSLVPLYIESAFTSRGVSQRDSSNWKTRSSKTLWQEFR